MKTVAGILSTQLLFKAYNLRDDIFIKNEDEMIIPPGLKSKPTEGEEAPTKINNLSNEPKKRKQQSSQIAPLSQRIDNYLIHNNNKVRQCDVNGKQMSLNNQRPRAIDSTIGGNGFVQESNIQLSFLECSPTARSNFSGSGVASTHPLQPPTSP